MKEKCRECIHNTVCKLSGEYKEKFIKVADISDDVFTIELNCSYYKSNNLVHGHERLFNQITQTKPQIKWGD